MVHNPSASHLPGGGSNKNEGCGQQIVFFLTILWVIGTSITAQAISWTIEQTVFEGSLGTPNIRWIVSLAYAALIFFPFLFFSLSSVSKRNRNAFRAWALAGLLSLLTSPARIVDIQAYQPTALLQIIALGIFCITALFLTSYLTKQTGDQSLKPGINLRGWGLAWIIVPLPIIPWLLWGALGSPIDTILGVIVGGLFGISCGLTIFIGMSGRPQEEIANSRMSFLRDTAVVLMILLILLTGIGQSGNQWILLLSTIGLSGACTALLYLGWNQKRILNWTAVAWMVGLVAVQPLVWLDPDELMLVIGMSTGEILEWANRMALISLLIGFLISILAIIFYKRILAFNRLHFSGKILLPLLWLGLCLIYFFAGKPGFYGERIFVILKDQANVSEFEKINNPLERREKVYHALVDHANTTQEEIRASLKKFNIEYTPYYLVNGLEVQAGPLVRLWLSTYPEVDRILDSPRLRPLPKPIPQSEGIDAKPDNIMWNQKMIRADLVWEKLNITGKGIIIGHSDSGVQGDHPELAASYRGKGGDNDFNWYDPWNHSSIPVDIGGHGTHTLGTILGKNTGIAPGAEWIGCVNLARNLGNTAYYLDCLQFMLAPFPQDGNPLKDGDPARGAHVLNNSWGCPSVEGCDPNVMLPAVNALKTAGVFMVVSAGNSGLSGCSSVDTPPAIYASVYSVGAVNSEGKMTDFSSIGPVTVDGSNRPKPDILAPGEDILSSFPGGTYSRLAGTSMAGPHVAGVIALMWSANPRLIGDIDATIKILDETAMPYKYAYPECTQKNSISVYNPSYGIVDAYAAVTKAIEYSK